MTADISDAENLQLASLTEPPRDFEGLSVEDAVEQIRGWFFENYEDPVHETPYNGREGGYLYIWGGPYNASDVIWNAFSGVAPDEIVEAAVESIEADGNEWAANGRRVMPPEPDFDDMPEAPPPPSVSELHERMLNRLTALEEALAALPSRTPGLGHNNPPEPIEEELLSPVDCERIRAAIIVLKAQPPEPPAPPPEAAEAAGVLSTFGSKLTNYLIAKGELFVTEFVKGAGGAAGKMAVAVPVWTAVATALIAASGSASAWLHAIGKLF